MILKMSKVSLIGPQELLTEVMASVYEAGVLQIEPPPDIVINSPYVGKVPLSTGQKKEMTELEETFSLAGKTRNTISPLFIKFPAVTPYRYGKISVSEAKRVIEEIGNMVDNLSREIMGLEQQLSVFTKYEKVLRALIPLTEMILESPFREYSGITLSRRESTLSLLEDALQRITGGRHELLRKDIDEETTACIVVYPMEFDLQIKTLFQEKNISELRMPAELTDMPIRESLNVILGKMNTLPDSIGNLEKRLHGLALERYQELVLSHRTIEQRLVQIKASDGLYGTKNTFLLYGWIPERVLYSFRDNIKKRFNELIIVDVLQPAPAEMENAPVLLNNPWFIRPFEMLTRFLSLPQYGTFDPTPLLAVFFPIFFGLILGDIGYGAVLFVASLWARTWWRGNKLIRDMGSIFMACSFIAVVFGFIFGEFFGNLGESIGIHPFVNRSEALIPFLIFSIIIGGFHISTGLVIGIIIAFKKKAPKEAIARLFKLIFVFSIFGTSAALFGLLPDSMFSIMIIMGIVTILSLFIFEKWFAPIDTMKLVVNILSYARIMGFGAASIFIASIANKFTTMPQNIFLGIALGTFFHIINIIVGIYAPAIQTLRLHYVEFFDKFFYPGGREYRPLGGE